MKNNKGQALVEFIIIVPVLIFIIMAIIDFGNIFYKKMQLENNLDTVVKLYEKGNIGDIQFIANEKDFVFTYNSQQNITTITLRQDIKIFTPFLNLILGNNYRLETERTIYEQ